MALKHLIIHGISRPHSTGQVKLSLRDKAIELNGVVEEFYREVKQGLLKRTAKDYGRFSDNVAEFPCSQYFREHHEDKLSFVSLSHKFAGQFQSELEKLEVPFEGYVLLAKEALEEGDFYHVCVIQHERGLYLNSDVDLDESIYLDLQAVRLSARINVSAWLGEDDQRAANAITMTLWRGEKELSEVFKFALGFTDKVDIAAETEQFVEVVNEYTKDVPDQTADLVRKKVVEYCDIQRQLNKPVVIERLSEEMYEAVAGDEASADRPMPRLDHFVKQRQAKVAREFMPDNKQIKNLVRIAGRNDLLSMSFASSCLGETVIYDPNEDTLIIKNIPTALKARLKKHLV